MRAVKGTFGYLEKKKRNAILWTILCFGISLAVFLAGYLTTGTRKNLLTVVAVLGCLPACKSIVNLIMSIRMNRRIGNISSKLGTIQSDKNDTIGIVFCKKCGSKYSVADRQCPFCGEKRQ